MVSTLPWWLRGFHPPMVSTLLWWLCGVHSPMVSTLPWCLPSRGYSVVSTLSWLLRGVHPSLVSLLGFHPAVVSTLLWLLCGVHPPVVSTLSWLLHGVHPGFWLKLAWKWQFSWLPSVVSTFLGYSVVSTLSWCPPFHGFHSAMVSNLPWLLRGVHPGFWLKLAWKWQFSWLPSVVSTSCGDSVVSAILKHILLLWLSGRKWNHSLFVNWLPGLWLEISLEMTTFMVTTCGTPPVVSVVSLVVSLLFPLWFPASLWVACLDCGLKLAWKWKLSWLPVVSMVETTSWFPFQSNLTAKSYDHPNQPIRSLYSLKSPRKLWNLWDFVRFHPKFYSHTKNKAVRTALLKSNVKFYLAFGTILDFRLDVLLFSCTSSRELRHATCRNNQY